MAHDISFLLRIRKIAQEMDGPQILPEGTTLSEEEKHKLDHMWKSSLHELEDAKRKHEDSVEYIQNMLPGLKANYEADVASKSQYASLSQQNYVAEIQKLHHHQERIEAIDKQIQNKDYI